MVVGDLRKLRPATKTGSLRLYIPTAEGLLERSLEFGQGSDKQYTYENPPTDKKQSIENRASRASPKWYMKKYTFRNSYIN